MNAPLPPSYFPQYSSDDLAVLGRVFEQLAAARLTAEDVAAYAMLGTARGLLDDEFWGADVTTMEQAVNELYDTIVETANEDLDEIADRAIAMSRAMGR